MTIITTGLLPIYMEETGQYQRMPLIIIDKKVVTNKETVSKDVLTQMFAFNEMHPYEIEWLSKHHPDYKDGLDIKLLMHGKQWQYLTLTKLDRLKLQMIWGRGFVGFFLNGDNFKSYIMPFLIAISVSLLTFFLKQHADNKLEGNQEPCQKKCQHD